VAGTWALITNPPANIDTMLLMTDGSVMAHELDSPNWHVLRPDAVGRYETGSWSAVPSMPNNPAIPAGQGGPIYAPKFFGSAVLRDGTLFIAGGEYNQGLQPGFDMAAATLYDPIANTWINLPTPAGWAKVGDVPLCVMPDGRVLLGNISTNQTVFFDPVTRTYAAGPNKLDQCAEESFTLLPDGTVLAVQCSSIPGAEKYVPNTNSWVTAGNTPATLPQACPNIVPEIGPTVLLTSGHAFVIGATGNTALYSPPAAPASPGTWTAGPVLRDASNNTIFPIDAPAVLLTNGKVLLTGSPAPPCSFPRPTLFFEYDPTTNLAALVPVPSNNGGPCFTGRLLMLPSGKVLFSSQSNTIAIYTPDGAPNAAWRPVITSFPSSVLPGNTYTLLGYQLNGLSQCSYYGDDATMATNYPIVRITNNTTGVVVWCRTANHSTMAVATGVTTVSTNVTIPATASPGAYTLTVVANGIPSAGLPIAIPGKVKFEKVEKFEKFEKSEKVEKIEKFEIKEIEKSGIKEIEKPIFDIQLKVAEAFATQGQAGDPALLAAIQELGDRVSALTAQVQELQAPITPEERPEVGDTALQHSSTPLKSE
jgi:hypothetical protein